jgi:CheY-like chemotaxis protein/HPt (histidine-containing phosphotransfer) domain-containing protein
MPVQILVVDDDAVSGEVLALLLHRAGYSVETVDSGDAAMLYLQTTQRQPDVVLADLQMPGTTGKELARRMRALCGPATTMLAMSGSAPDDDSAGEYDGFLLKPFAMEALAAAIDGKTHATTASNGATAAVLDRSIYRKLAGSMRPAQLEQLYALCLSDAEARLAGMRLASANGDDAAFRKAAHAIKGSCGMVGALELQTLATSMEEQGLSDDHVASLNEFVMACERLRGMLVAHRNHHNRSSESVSGEDA